AARSLRMVLSHSLAVGEELVGALRDFTSAVRVEPACSARGMSDSVEDLGIVAASSDPVALRRSLLPAWRRSTRCRLGRVRREGGYGFRPSDGAADRARVAFWALLQQRTGPQ
ncbi:MAG TPA: hypothetical protein VIQ02_07430, partial [Jiangellaceae bacterium]